MEMIKSRYWIHDDEESHILLLKQNQCPKYDLNSSDVSNNTWIKVLELCEFKHHLDICKSLEYQLEIQEPLVC